MKRLRWVIPHPIITLFLALAAVVSVGRTAILMGQCGLLTKGSGEQRIEFGLTTAPAPCPPCMVAETVGSIAGLNACGGVAFGSIAQPAGDAPVAVTLAYDAEREDGRRLAVSMVDADGSVTTVEAEIPDWQLVPIARFAASGHDGAVTLFGRLLDEEDDAEAKEGGYQIINYHPAFEGTLLGARLFQADVLMIEPHAGDLIETLSGELGHGEAPPDLIANHNALAQLYQELMPDGAPWVSYLVSDHRQTITFGAADDLLTLTGRPLWHTWRYEGTVAEVNARLAEISDEVNRSGVLDQLWMEALAAMEAERADDAATLPPAAFDEKWTDEYAVARRQAIFEESAYALIDAQASAEMLDVLTGFNDRISDRIESLGGVNPAVYTATVRTMRYAAFFRYVHALDPEGYRAFVQSLDEVALPAVGTATGYKHNQGAFPEPPPGPDPDGGPGEAGDAGVGVGADFGGEPGADAGVEADSAPGDAVAGDGAPGDVAGGDVEGGDGAALVDRGAIATPDADVDPGADGAPGAAPADEPTGLDTQTGCSCDVGGEQPSGGAAAALLLLGLLGRRARRRS